MKFKVGDRVGACIDPDEDIPCKPIYSEDYTIGFGEITSIKDDGVTIKWDDQNPDPIYDNISFDTKHIMSEDEMKKKYNSLEQDFLALQKEIKIKLKEAATIIKSANTLAKAQGLKLSDMYDAISPLYSALNASGWRTSSFDC